MAEFICKWSKSPEKFTDQEKRLLFSKVIEIMVLATFDSHFYKWAGSIYKQKAGGPIGLRASGVVPKVTMELWLIEMRVKMEKAGLKVHLLKKYVDNVLVVCTQAIDQGSR